MSRGVRVLHVVASRSRRGAETFAADLMRCLAADGVDQTVAILHPDRSAQLTYPVPVLVSDPGRGFHLPGLPLDKSRSFGRSAAAWLPDVVQAHGGEALKYTALAGLPREIPVVYRRIGSNDGWGAYSPKRAAYARLVRRSAFVVAVSEAAREESIRLFGLSPERVTTIVNGVDPDRIRATRDRTSVLTNLGVPPSSRIVLFLGALTDEKDPRTAIEVAGTVLTRDPLARVLMAGDGPLREAVRDAVARGPHRDRISLLGNVGSVGDLLGVADVLMLTSRTEGMPAAAIEAGMAGVPVVSFDLAGIPEIVRHGETGLLYRRRRVDEMARGITDLLADPAMRDRMADAARRVCVERFSIAPLAARYRELYEDLAAVPSGAW